jgi:hypothetical protein
MLVLSSCFRLVLIICQHKASTYCEGGICFATAEEHAWWTKWHTSTAATLYYDGRRVCFQGWPTIRFTPKEFLYRTGAAWSCSSHSELCTALYPLRDTDRFLLRSTLGPLDR